MPLDINSHRFIFSSLHASSFYPTENYKSLSKILVLKIMMPEIFIVMPIHWYKSILVLFNITKHNISKIKVFYLHLATTNNCIYHQDHKTKGLFT